MHRINEKNVRKGKEKEGGAANKKGKYPHKRGTLRNLSVSQNRKKRNGEHKKEKKRRSLSYQTLEFEKKKKQKCINDRNSKHE